MTSRPPREIWSAALGVLQMEVTRHNYETWLRHTTGLAYTDGRFVVGVPSPFVGECLQKRLCALIEKTLRSLLHEDLEVAFEVYQPWAGDGPSASSGNGHTPAEDRVAPTPSRQHRAGRLNPRYTFDTFVVGKSNRFAHAAAHAVSEDPGAAFNPLVIHSGVGLGKTHLLHAIGHALQARGLNALYVSAEQFTNDFVSALRDNTLEAFRAKYRSVDVFLIDDIQFIAGKEHSRESFFHTFNDLHTASKQVVITSDARPNSIQLMDERLRSRLEAGLTVDIKPPDLETRMAILQKKAGQAGVVLPEDVTEYIARKIVRNVRELEGALNRIVAMAQLTRQPIDMNLAQQTVTDLLTTAPRMRRVHPSDIIQAVATYYNLSHEQLVGKSRKKGIALARQVAAYLLREDTDRSLAEIGALLGDRGHTTALRAHDKIAYEINIDGDLRRQIGDIRDWLDRHPHATQPDATRA